MGSECCNDANLAANGLQCKLMCLLREAVFTVGEVSLSCTPFGSPEEIMVMWTQPSQQGKLNPPLNI